MHIDAYECNYCEACSQGMEIEYKNYHFCDPQCLYDFIEDTSIESLEELLVLQ